MCCIIEKSVPPWGTAELSQARHMSWGKRSASDLDIHCGGDSGTDCERCVPSDVGTARGRALYVGANNWERWPRALVLYCIITD